MSNADVFGSDIAIVGGDLDPFFGLVSGRACLIQAVLCRLSTPRGGLLDDPNYGLDVRAYCNTPITQSSTFAIQTAIGAEVTKDERILSAASVVTFDAATSTLRIVLAIVDADGPFALTLAATALTVEILTVNPAP